MGVECITVRVIPDPELNATMTPTKSAILHQNVAAMWDDQEVGQALVTTKWLTCAMVIILTPIYTLSKWEIRPRSAQADKGTNKAQSLVSQSSSSEDFVAPCIRGKLIAKRPRLRGLGEGSFDFGVRQKEY